MPSSNATVVENITKVKSFANALSQQDSDFAILFRHVYCLFNRTLCYSHNSFCPKGFFITNSDGKSINLFFVLDTPRLASEANLLIESSNHLLHGFVNIMVRITSSQSFNHNSGINNDTCVNNIRSSNDRAAIVPFIDEDHQDPSSKFFENSIFSSDISLKTFCEDYIKAVHNKAAVQQILVYFREISESIGSSDRFKIEIFKNCTCRSFFGDFFTVSRDILSICKVASFDKSAKKGLSKEQVDYLSSIKQDKPFYTLILKMERLIKNIVNPMFKFMNYCHRKADCSISHLLHKYCVMFKINSVSSQQNKSNSTSSGPYMSESEENETPNIYIPDINTEVREITFPKSPHLYKQLPTDPTTRKSQIEKDVFRLGALFLSYVTGSKEVGENSVESVSDMLKQLRMSVDYLRQTQAQFENMHITKKCGDDTKIYLMSERLAHLTALQYSLSIFERLVSEMVEQRTCTFKEMLQMIDRSAIDRMIENLRDKSFDEKMSSCARISNSVQAILGKDNEKRKINERSRMILSDVTNSSLSTKAPDSPMTLSTPTNKRKLEATVQYFCKIPAKKVVKNENVENSKQDTNMIINRK